MAGAAALALQCRNPSPGRSVYGVDNLQRQHSVGQSTLQALTGHGAIRSSYDLALLIQQNGIATLQGGQRAAGMETVSGLPQALAALLHLLLQGALQPLLQALQLLGSCVQLALGILQLPALVQMLYLLLALSLRGGPGRQQPLPQLIQAFAAALQPCQRLLASQTNLQMIQLLASALQIMSGLLEQATLPLLQPMQQGGSIRHQQLRRRRRRRCAEIGDQVGNREVDLVADRADHRYGGGINGTSQRFVVEAPQILHRAAAAGQQNRIVALAALGLVQHADHGRGRFTTLHRHRQDLGIDQRKPTGPDAEHSADRGPLGEVITAIRPR